LAAAIPVLDKRGEESPSLRTIVNLATVLQQKPSEMAQKDGTDCEFFPLLNRLEHPS
jgi:hypothetical protein